MCSFYFLRQYPHVPTPTLRISTFLAKLFPLPLLLISNAILRRQQQIYPASSTLSACPCTSPVSSCYLLQNPYFQLFKTVSGNLSTLFRPFLQGNSPSLKVSGYHATLLSSSYFRVSPSRVPTSPRKGARLHCSSYLAVVMSSLGPRVSQVMLSLTCA